ncbi:PREDICTED: glucose-1-phosphate adenylyltransferase small subunit, chloroplastic/amyloplastic-like [Ipomoea nil]|uniref:glucose-1-phosphate adenylyltransferase small subunit, chloroplastic/amyloplastic-like n=1 Tax=Ipomoea nil TaxID=35883 RepID=UPI000901DADB|nr:PREDICTED: glucose-1-phosphate adenylyltransferase small subunit, chloroplastic/amyloplastic-like [Ipomoea nil]
MKTLIQFVEFQPCMFFDHDDEFDDNEDAKDEVIIGPTTVGGIQASAFRIGDTTVEQLITLFNVYRPRSVGLFYDRSTPIYTQPRDLSPSKMLGVDVTDSVIGESCVIKNCKIHHSVVGLRSCISEVAIIEDTLLMGAVYYEVIIHVDTE